MANYVSVMVDTELMEQGKFYELVVDKNATTVLFKTQTVKKFDFNNVKYFRCPEEYDGYSIFSIWKVIETNGEPRFENITSGVRVVMFYENGKRFISIESNQAISGFIQFN